MDVADIRSEMNKRTWLHCFELMPGLWSPGRVPVDARAALTQHGIAEDLRGSRVIDIGASDGAYSLEFARRGATLLSVDLQNPDQTGFSLASKLAGFRIEYREMS